MKITLANCNSGSDFKKGEVKKELVFIAREQEILIATSDGREIATLSLDIMHGENKTNSGNWWLIFNAKEMSLDKNIADVIENET